MNLIRIQKTTFEPGTYFQMSHAAARDSFLTLEARGLLTYLISLGDGWKFDVSELRVQGLGRERIQRILRELEMEGYLTRIQQRDPRTKRYTMSVWKIDLFPRKPYDEPEGEEPPQNDPESGNPTRGTSGSSKPTHPKIKIPPVERKKRHIMHSRSPETRGRGGRPESEESDSKESDQKREDDQDLFFTSLTQIFGSMNASQRQEFDDERVRLGDEKIRVVVERVQKRSPRFPLHYLLSALKNEPAERFGLPQIPPPSSAPPPAVEPDFPAWRLPTPYPDAVESETVCSESDPITEPEMITQRERDRWDLALTQVKHQWDRATFETLLGRAVLLRVDPDGHYVVQVGSEHAKQMLSTRLYRNVKRVLSDVTCQSDVEIVFEAAPPPKPPKWLYPDTPVYAGGAS